jgi:hypothetical protein
VLKREKTQSIQRRSLALFVQGIVIKNRSQFPQRAISQGVLSKKDVVNFYGGLVRKEYCSRKTESIFPARELLLSSRSHSFRFLRNRKTVPVRAPRYFPEQYPLLIGLFLLKGLARSVSSPGGIAAQYRVTTIPPGETFFLSDTPSLISRRN